MEQKEIIEGNKLIAEFMNLKYINWNDECMLWTHKSFIEDFTDVNNFSKDSKFDWENSLPQSKNLYYNTSWDWLMPVVEKIEVLGSSTIMNRVIYSRFKITHNHIILYWSKNNGYQLQLEVLPE